MHNDNVHVVTRNAGLFPGSRSACVRRSRGHKIGEVRMLSLRMNRSSCGNRAVVRAGGLVRRFAIVALAVLPPVCGSVSRALEPDAAPPSDVQAGRDGKPENAWRSAGRYVRFDSLEEAVAHAEDVLRGQEHADDAALVYIISTPDDRPISARTELHFVGREGGYIPGSVRTDRPVFRLILVTRRARPMELRIFAPGFERATRRAILHPGEILVWDDIFLEPLTNSSAASLHGRVWLEDDADLEGMVIYVEDEAVTFTDSSGHFVAERVSPGKLRVSTNKTGYVGLHTEVRAARGSEVPCELRGYRERFASVRWAYQPNGTHDFFRADALTGIAVLSPRRLNRVKFAGGVRKVSGQSDFLIIQEKDRLIVRNFDQSGRNGPGFVVLKDTSFEDVLEAPDVKYRPSEKKLRPGVVYVFRCYDGKHYAKMEVLEITDKPPLPEE